MNPTGTTAKIAVWEACDRAHIGIDSLLRWSNVRHATTRPLVTAMQQIADWLKELGMAEYAERFANHIDIGVLRDLMDQDLKDLGVVPIGHRRKVLRAISELAEARTVPHRPPLTYLSKSVDHAERRQLAGHSGASVGGA
jgi:hypothetical protein